MSMNPAPPISPRAPLRCLNALRPAGRADLLRMHAAGIGLDEAAALLGYDVLKTVGDGANESKVTADANAPQPELPDATASANGEAVNEDSKAVAAPPLWRMIGPQLRPYDEKQVLATPDWARGLQACSDEELATKWNLQPRPAPLLAKPRLGPVLRRLLRVPTELSVIDSSKFVQALATCRTPRRVPRLVRPSWTPRLQLYWDQSARLGGFWHDQRDVYRWLRAWRGEQGLELIIVNDEGRAQWQKPLGRGRHARVLTPSPLLPDAGTTMLALSDLGHHAADAHMQKEWLRWATRARERGARTHSLCPVPKLRCDSSLKQKYCVHEWERTRPLGDTATQQQPSPEQQRQVLEQLFTYLSPSVCVDWALLRAIRRLLPKGIAPASLEIDAFLDARAVGQCEDGFVIEYEAAKHLRQKLSEPARNTVARVFEKVHSYFGLAMRAEEQLIWGNEAERRAAEQDIARYVQHLRQERLPTQTERGYAERNEHRQAPSGWRSRPLAAYWAVHHAKGGGFDSALPDGLDVHDVLWVLEQVPPPVACHVWQRGSQLMLVSSEGLKPSFWETPGCVVGELVFRVREVDVRLESVLGAPLRERVAVRDPRKVALPTATYGQRLRLETDMSTVDLVQQSKPQWASSFFRNQEGLWLQTELRQSAPQTVLYPPWATRLEKDAYGLYAELELAPNVITRLRWIPPGRFLMGSPDDENGRAEWEGPQHWVTLTQGFWLAEAPSTQAEWIAVMGDNPSAFKHDERCPVEQVSWDECQAFCRKLNERWPGLNARLPSEAQWEYACRAGTQSAYNDGSECTAPEGNDPALMKLGWFDDNSERKTHPVKQLAPNAWGIHDAHGNVFEWCQDYWAENYSVAEQPDPTGPDTGTDRVIRGGSWFFQARVCRSAYRLGLPPTVRGYLGFRFAAGQVSQGMQASETSGRLRRDEGRGAQAADGERSRREQQKTTKGTPRKRTKRAK